VTPAGRRCPTPGCPRILTNPSARYCPTHAREYEARRGSSTARGYGSAHQRHRTTYTDQLAAGVQLRCRTCGDPITVFDLGHTEDRTAYLGPQCLPCNRGDGGRRGRATQ
jgi:hypothetical protein